MPNLQTSAAGVADAVTAVLEKHPELKVAYLYGSAAKDRLHPESDVDVAVLAKSPLSFDEKFELEVELSRATERDIDLVDLHELTGTLLKEILCDGQRLLVRSHLANAELIRRMVYNQADEMPYYRRILAARRERFINE